MGLDISAYRQLRSIGPREDASEYAITLPDNHADFAGREAGIDVSRAYQAVSRFRFPAGSYGGYSAWRNELAKMIGFESAKAAYADPKPGPFIELINFTDCDGAIGPLVAAKLAADFDAHAEAAKASSYPGFWRLYDDFRIAFHLAADSGAVHFH